MLDISSFQVLEQIQYIALYLSSLVGTFGAGTTVINDKFGAYLGAGIAATAGMGTGLGQGSSAGRGAEATARNPEAVSKIRTTMIIGMALAESSAIYGLIVAILLIFVSSPNPS